MDINETPTQNGSNSAQDVLTKLVNVVSELSTEHTKEMIVLESKLRSSSNWLQVGLEIENNDLNFSNKLNSEITNALKELSIFLK